MQKNRPNIPDDDEIIEESVFGINQFKDMIAWLKDRQGYTMDCQITGKWAQTDDFFKGRGRILKKYDGSLFSDTLYLLLNEGNVGKEEILIGRRIIEIHSRKLVEPFKGIKKILKNETLIEQVSETINPNVFVIDNEFHKDVQNRVFFRNSEYERAINWLQSFTQKYEVSCHIEGVLVDKNRQIPCILTGTVKSVNDSNEIFVKLWDAFDPSDPLNDETKEWLTRSWTIQVSQSGIPSVHPKYMLFEIGEELAMTKKVLSVNDVKVVLGGRTIIHDVNFEVLKGEILGIIGESGAGKSTTLKAILGEFDYSGKISVFGINAHDTKAIAPFIGYVPQDLSRMYANFNCLENIVAFGRQFGVPDDILIQRGKKILKDLGIDHVANQNVESLSGGQKRRASIAISMVHNPYLLFLDEPTSGLDPLARYELWEYLDIINKEYGITLIVISHYLDEIEYCDKACIFLRGLGFFDYNSPGGLKRSLPGKGIALEVTLEEVNIEAVDLLRNIKGVTFIIQRGERIRLLSKLPSRILSDRVLNTLEEHGIPIHSIEFKVEIDMVDYFSYVSSQHLSGKLSEVEMRNLTKGEVEVMSAKSYLPNQGKILEVSVESDKKLTDMVQPQIKKSPKKVSKKQNKTPPSSQSKEISSKTVKMPKENENADFDEMKVNFTKYLFVLQKKKAHYSMYQLVNLFISLAGVFGLETDEYNYYLDKYEGVIRSKNDLTDQKIQDYEFTLVDRLEKITGNEFDPSKLPKNLKKEFQINLQDSPNKTKILSLQPKSKKLEENRSAVKVKSKKKKDSKSSNPFI